MGKSAAILCTAIAFLTIQPTVQAQGTGYRNTSGNQILDANGDSVERQDGKKVTVSNESYNGTLPAGGSVQGVGFIASYSGTNAVPTNFTLNGVPCK